MFLEKASYATISEWIFSYSNKPNPAALNNNKGVVNGSNNGSSEVPVSLGGKACESCNGKLDLFFSKCKFLTSFIAPVTVSSQWYAWGPSHMQCRLCQACWQYWKRYGGLKNPTRFGDGEYDGKKKSGSDDEDGRSVMSHRPHR